MFLEDQFSGVPDTEYVTPPIFQPDAAIDDWLSPNSEISPTLTSLPSLPSSDTTAPLPTTVTPPENTTAIVIEPDKNTTSSFSVSPNTEQCDSLPSTDPLRPIDPLPSTDSPPLPGLPEVLGRDHHRSKPSVLLK